MSKYLYIFVLGLLSVFSVQGKPILDKIKGKPYHFAFMITNPLSGYSKFGGMLEIRAKQNSVVLGATDYYGGYNGLKYNLEYQHYIPTIYRNESFWYLKVIGGSAQYNAEKLSLITNDQSKEIFGPYDFVGAGFGYGRRWNFNKTFIMCNIGLKYTKITSDISDEVYDRFRVFYMTGPGSVFELNFRFGFQR